MPIIHTPAVQQVARTIDRYAMMANGDSVLAAVSGGADSTALLHILHALAGDLGIRLAVAHLNHGLRGRAADRDARFVADMAAGLNLTFHGHRVRLDPAAGSLEASGRQARYAFLYRLAEEHGYTKIALGHHMDDNAEAVLLHLLRGSGLRGLSGIPPVRDPGIVRPLMDLRRSDIIAFLHHHRIAYVEDASNADLRFDRNRVRHQVIPFLERQFNVDPAVMLNRTADLCRHEEIWLQGLLAPAVKALIVSVGPQRMTLLVHELEAEPLAVQRRLIREALRNWRSDITGIGVAHIDSVIGLLSPRFEGKRICLPNLIGVERSRKHLIFSIRRGRGFSPRDPTRDYLVRIPSPGPRPMEVQIPESGYRFQFSICSYPLNSKGNTAAADTAWFDTNAIEFPLVIRNFRPGDRMSLAGMSGHRKLKKILGDCKIPMDRRSSRPLLISGNDIIWAAGIRRSALAIPSAATEQVLKVRMLESGRVGPNDG